MVAPAADHADRATLLSSEQLVERIQQINPTAGAEFLARFRPEALSLYLAHLRSVKDAARGPEAGWVRPGDTPAMMVREPAE